MLVYLSYQHRNNFIKNQKFEDDFISGEVSRKVVYLLAIYSITEAIDVECSKSTLCIN